MSSRRTVSLGFALICLGLASAPTWAQEREVKVKGRVVDADGHPVPGAKVGSMWHASVGTKQDAFAPVVTDDDGRFTAKVDFFGRDAVTLEQLLKPLGLVSVVKDEVVLIVRQPSP